MSATPRNIRKVAFQALFQLDARGERDSQAIRDSIDHDQDSGLTVKELDKAFELALGAFGARAAADQEMLALAPTWPSHRQAAVDRAILRLAHFEIVSGKTLPKIAVNEAVELAKEFSTDKSPAFVNGLLDKVLKKYLKEADAAKAAANVLGETAETEAADVESASPPVPPTPSLKDGE